MPKRPTRNKSARTGSTKGGIPDKATPGDQRSQDRHRDFATRAILGKFQGRKSI